MKRLIVNADDFGFTAGVNRGIIRAFTEGIVTSTTLLANGPAFDEAVTLAQRHPSLSVGCHLSLVGGRATARPEQIPTLVSSAGELPATLTDLLRLLLRGRIASGDIEREFLAQARKVVDAGIRPTHFDTHKHTHAFGQVMEAVCRVGEQVGVRRLRFPVERSSWRHLFNVDGWGRRWTYAAQAAPAGVLSLRAGRLRQALRNRSFRAPDFLRGVALTGLLDCATLPAVLRSLAPGVTELTCHPGLWDPELDQARTRLKKERQLEIEALTDPSLRSILSREGISLIGFRDLD